jgi:hypothetical protein
MERMSKTAFSTLIQSLNEYLLFRDGGAIPCLLTVPDDARVAVITGDNAAGKSFVTRIYSQLARENEKNLECIHLSMSKRAGNDGSYGMVRAMMFGDESRESTGTISSHVIKMAFKTGAERDHKNIIIIDEPDIGLSDGYHKAVGQFIAQECLAMKDATVGAIIVTHARKIVQEIIASCSTALVQVSDHNGNIQHFGDWLENGPPDHSLEDFVNLQHNAHQRFKLIQSHMNEVESSRSKHATKPKP